MSSWLDHLPSQEREKIRKRMRSPEEYERLREKVKGPEDLEREMEKNAEFAEARLTLESEPKAQEKAKDIVQAYIAEEGIPASVENPTASVVDMLSSGNFEVIIVEQNHEPTLAVRPSTGETVSATSGNVSEVFSLKPALQQQLLATFTLK